MIGEIGHYDMDDIELFVKRELSRKAEDRYAAKLYTDEMDWQSLFAKFSTEKDITNNGIGDWWAFHAENHYTEKSIAAHIYCHFLLGVFDKGKHYELGDFYDFYWRCDSYICPSPNYIQGDALGRKVWNLPFSALVYEYFLCFLTMPNNWVFDEFFEQIANWIVIKQRGLKSPDPNFEKFCLKYQNTFFVAQGSDFPLNFGNKHLFAGEAIKGNHYATRRIYDHLVRLGVPSDVNQAVPERFRLIPKRLR